MSRLLFVAEGRKSDFKDIPWGAFAACCSNPAHIFLKANVTPIKMDPKKRHHFLAQFFMSFAFFDWFYHSLDLLMPNELKSKPENGAFC